MPKVQKTILSLLAFLTTLFLVHLSPLSVQAAGCTPPLIAPPWYNQDPCTFSKKVDGGDKNEIFGERYTFAQINWIINSLNIMLNPVDALASNADLNALIKSIECITNPTPACVTPSLPNPYWHLYSKLGIPGLLLGSISEIQSTPTASGFNDISNTLSKFDLAAPVHAQGGYGFRTLDGVQSLWSASRNMAYLIMVILLVATGFMIMFRVKINPQTAVSLQIMIPKVVFTLLLVTFSYAIAGLVIDMVYVVLAFILSGLTLTGAINPGVLSGSVSWFFSPDYGRIVSYYIGALLSFLLRGFSISTMLNLIPGIGQALSAFTGTISAIISIIMTVIIAWLLFKVWWMMVKTYLTLMFLIIVGPWQIMLGLLPGQQGFGSWFRNVIANASVFLTVPIMFMLNMFFWPLSFLSPLGQIADPSSALYPNFPLFSGKGGLFSFAIGFAVLSMIPKVADIIRDALKIPPFKYGTAMGEALTPFPIKATGQYAGQWLSDTAKDPRITPGSAAERILHLTGSAINRASGGKG